MKDDYNLLVVYWKPVAAPLRPAIQHHLTAVDPLCRRGQVFYVNAYLPVPSWLRWMRFDAVILHTTFLCMRWADRYEDYRTRLSWIRDMPCPKIAVPQDEYDHSDVLDEWLYDWGIDAILSNFREDLRKTLYPINAERARFYHVFTGYIHAETAAECSQVARPLEDRDLDIVYRACNLPLWFGHHGASKSTIGIRVDERARELGLKTDISTRPEDTIESHQWFGFLGSSRATIGVESGSSVLDRRGERRAAIRHLLQQKPDLTLTDLDEHLPGGWDSYAFFAISPRHFEAIMTKTCQLLVEGHYDGCLEAGRHYIPLRPDLSNLDEVLSLLRDAKVLKEITQCAFEEIYQSGRFTYAQYAQTIERAIEESKLPHEADSSHSRTDSVHSSLNRPKRPRLSIQPTATTKRLARFHAMASMSFKAAPAISSGDGHRRLRTVLGETYRRIPPGPRAMIRPLMRPIRSVVDALL